MSDKSFDLFSKEHAASEKFDYFICSVAGALFAYIAQNYQPHKLDSWYHCLMPAALLSLTLSFLFGAWLIKKGIEITKINKECVAAIERNVAIQNNLRETDSKQGNY